MRRAGFRQIVAYLENVEKGLMARDATTIKRFLGVLARVALSLLFAGILHTGWMAVAIPTINSGFGGWIIKAALWVLAPIATALGFAIGPKVFEFLPMTDKRQFRETYKWCLIGCAIGGGVFYLFGPMLIVFGMFLAGTLSIVMFELVKGVQRAGEESRERGKQQETR